MCSMGRVKNRYLHYEKACDQYLGRVVSGLNVQTYEFAVSPPYFEIAKMTNSKLRFCQSKTIPIEIAT